MKEGHIIKYVGKNVIVMLKRKVVLVGKLIAIEDEAIEIEHPQYGITTINLDSIEQISENFEVL